MRMNVFFSVWIKYFFFILENYRVLFLNCIYIDYVIGSDEYYVFVIKRLVVEV